MRSLANYKSIPFIFLNSWNLIKNKLLFILISSSSVTFQLNIYILYFSKNNFNMPSSCWVTFRRSLWLKWQRNKTLELRSHVYLQWLNRVCVAMKIREIIMKKKNFGYFHKFHSSNSAKKSLLSSAYKLEFPVLLVNFSTASVISRRQ